MIVTIHQPEHLPWLGFFDKIGKADLFLILDSVQFRKNYFQNRNKIRVNSPDGWTWLTVPVLQKGKFGQTIAEVEINNDSNWQEKHRRTIEQAYARSPFLKDHRGFLDEVYGKTWSRLADLNICIIRYLMEQFGQKTPIKRTSEMEHGDGQKSDLILDLCQRSGATTYLSGAFGRDYLDLDAWKRAGIDVVFHAFSHPTYPQTYQPFVPGLSAADLLFNVGPESRSFLGHAN